MKRGGGTHTAPPASGEHQAYTGGAAARPRGLVSRETLARVTEETDLVALVAERVELRVRSGRLFGRCPFHEEKAASFTILPHGRRYYCHGCGAHGDAIAWLQETGQVRDFRESVTELCRRGGIFLDEAPRSAPRSVRAPAPTRSDQSVWEEALRLAEAASDEERRAALLSFSERPDASVRL